MSGVTEGPCRGMMTWTFEVESGRFLFKSSTKRSMYRDFPIPERSEDTTRTQELQSMYVSSEWLIKRLI